HEHTEAAEGEVRLAVAHGAEAWRECQDARDEEEPARLVGTGSSKQCRHSPQYEAHREGSPEDVSDGRQQHVERREEQGELRKIVESPSIRVEIAPRRPALDGQVEDGRHGPPGRIARHHHADGEQRRQPERDPEPGAAALSGGAVGGSHRLARSGEGARKSDRPDGLTKREPADPVRGTAWPGFTSKAAYQGSTLRTAAARNS